MHTTTIKKQQRKDRKEIEEMTRKFLEQGGQIKQCESRPFDRDDYKPAMAWDGMR